MKVKPSISVASLAKKDSRDTPQNSLNKRFKEKEKVIDCFLGLIEEFPDNCS
jgi:hypothetical protein